MKSFDLLGNFQSCSSEFTPVSQQLLRAFAARDLMFGNVTLQLFQTSFVELTYILQSFNRPLEILLAAIFMLVRFHLIRESYYVANVKSTCRELVANPEQFHYGDWRTSDRFFSALLPALDSLGNRNFLLACEQWNDTHLAHINANGIGSLVHLSGRKIELYFFAYTFF